MYFPYPENYIFLGFTVFALAIIHHYIANYGQKKKLRRRYIIIICCI